MKVSPLLAGVAGLTLIALTATTLYAQTATGTSLVDKMKAVAHTFTLSADLNAGQTGFESAPIAGKKTGNILTTGEWNRMLELMSEGGGGSGCTPSSGDVYDSGWKPVVAGTPIVLTHNLGTEDTLVYTEWKAGSNVAWNTPIPQGSINTLYAGYNKLFYNKTATSITLYNGDTGWDTGKEVRVIMWKKSALGGGCSGSSGGGDKFTFLDTEKVLISSGVTTANKAVTTLDISTIAGVVIPAGAKAIQVYVQCNNYTVQNQATMLWLGKSTASLFVACQSNGLLSGNDVDSNSLIIPLAPDGKTIVYKYDIPNTDTGGQIAVYLRGFITE